jgi:hypothetical protein
MGMLFQESRSLPALVRVESAPGEFGDSAVADTVPGLRG